MHFGILWIKISARNILDILGRKVIPKVIELNGAAITVIGERNDLQVAVLIDNHLTPNPYMEGGLCDLWGQVLTDTHQMGEGGLVILMPIKGEKVVWSY